MTATLHIHGWGAVTPVGLTAPSTCAAVRAGINRFEDTFVSGPAAPTRKISTVRAARALKNDYGEWLSNLAVRALSEAIGAQPFDANRAALLVLYPSDDRPAPAPSTAVFVQALQKKARLAFAEVHVVSEADKTLAGLLRLVQELTASNKVAECIVGAADSFLSAAELRQLEGAGRLHGEDNPRGMFPSEGAAFLRVSPSLYGYPLRPVGRIVGFAETREAEQSQARGRSVGDAMRLATGQALGRAGLPESSVGLVCSNFAGERDQGWEQTFAHAKTYRTRRPRLPKLWPGMSVGDIGCASVMLSPIAAGMALARGYGNAGVATCEAYSRFGPRGCVVVASPDRTAFVGPGVRAPT